MLSSNQRPSAPIRSKSCNAPNLSTSTNQRTQTTPLPGLTKSKSTIHLPLYRRILFPHDDPSSIIPKIVKYNNGCENEKELEFINEKLYNLIALALRGYILSWYSRFSSNRTLSPIINQKIVFPILHEIVTEVYNDPDKLCYLLLIDLPLILNLHIKTCKESKLSLEYVSTNNEEADDDLGRRYHSRLPLRSIEFNSQNREYEISSIYLTSLSNSIINHFIQNQDQDGNGSKTNLPDVEKLMIREVLSKSILNSIIRRLCENWFWYQLVLKILGDPSDGNFSNTLNNPDEKENIRYADEKHTESKFRSIDQIMIYWFHTILGIIFRIWNISVSILTLYSSSPREYNEKYQKCYEPLLSLFREILDIDGRRTWLKSFIWGIVELIVNLFGPILDRLLPHLIRIFILTPKNSIKIIVLIEKILFPDGYPSQSPPDPTFEEVVILRDKAERRLDELIPKYMKTILLHLYSKSTPKLTPASTLDMIENRSCNLHLIGMILNNLIATLVPDLVIPIYEEQTGSI
ncbi:uncharacterized protein L201_007868 [Kwoniella dendrophila CBS 6074]|uniref:PXA domain-containing protein n=1 Tax=Kwoniella dendrophila CBS 6074 TaxID=1295534 RepID=A0AAX4K5B0_9TREE